MKDGLKTYEGLCAVASMRAREGAWRERILRDPQGAAARVERRLAAEDPAYRLCRRASGAALGLPEEARP